MSSGFSVQTTPNTTNGIVKIPMIPRTVLNCYSETVGLLIIHCNGKLMIIQITPKRIISLAFAFLSFIDFDTRWLY